MDGRTELRRFLAAARRWWWARRAVRAVLGAVALAAGVGLVLAALGALGILPASVHPHARWLVPLSLALVPAVAVVRGLFRAPSDRTLALRLEEVSPPAGHLPSVLLELAPSHPFAGELQGQLEPHLQAERPARLTGTWVRKWEGVGAGALLAAALVPLLALGGPGALWSQWGEPTTGMAAERIAEGELPDQAGGEVADPLSDLVVQVTPPDYTGLPPFQWTSGEPVTAVAGSRVLVLGPAPEGILPEIRLLRADEETRTLPPRSDPPRSAEPDPPSPYWSADWTLAEGDRGLLVSGRWGEQVRERVIPLQPLADDPPQVELLEPTSDMVLAGGSGQVTFRARARDPFGVEAFQLTWVHTRGSGESFDFREDTREWASVRDTDDGVEGILVLNLEELGLAPGEVLHLRAVARDVNSVTGPGTGVSRTRQIRVAREGEEMQVDALIGLPLEADREPVLSQRMILLMTEELLARVPTLGEEEFTMEAYRIAREQARLRGQVADQVFSRATGAMEPVTRHLGQGLHSQGDHTHGQAALSLTREVHGEHDPGDPHPHEDADDALGEHRDHLHREGEPPARRRGSPYGVAAIFDPSVPDEPEPERRVHPEQSAPPLLGPDIPERFDAGTDVGSFTVGGPGRMPTGFGVLAELGHDHDGDPILSVNQPLLEIHNAMWEAERRLRLVDPGASVPHQEEALTGLQALRENTRVFPRGRVTAPPVDVAGVRGTGEVDDADPIRRSPGVERATAHRWLGELEGALEALEGDDETVAPASIQNRLTALAAGLLGDAAVPTSAGALVARAADDPTQAPQLLRDALDLLDPAPQRAAETTWIRSPSGPLAAAFASVRPPSPAERGRAAADEAGPTQPNRPTQSAQSTQPAQSGHGEDEIRPFVFATLRYESGNWDSAPLVPQNLIHALAQYTDMPVEPEGVVVDLASREIFQYPVLYLTGHLPVRFSDVEARNLKSYVERGGFVFMDDHNHDIDGAFHRTATAELARIFGEDALEPLPNDHELYRTFFHFEDGPPTTSHELSGWGDGLIHPELHAVMVNGRIGVLYSNKDYSSEWNYHAVNKRFLAVDNTRFGVNLLIYGLTR